MRISIKVLKVFFCLLFFVAPKTFAEKLETRLVDEAAIFSRTEQQELNQALEKLKQEKQIDLVVLTVATLHGQPIEDFAVKRFQQYTIGSKNIDNGLLFVAAINDHKMRLEVGYGLEGSLPDITAKRLLEGVIKPFFKEQKYVQGIKALIRQISEQSLEVQGDIKKTPKIPVGIRFFPLGLFAFFFLFVYFLGYKQDIIAEKSDLNSVFGKEWPEEAKACQRREPFLRLVVKVLFVSFLLVGLVASAMAFFTDNDWFLIGAILTNFCMGFLFLGLMKACQFSCKWEKWHKRYQDPVRSKIQKHLKGLGYSYSSGSDTFSPMRSSSASSSGSSSSSPSDGGSSGGGGASSDW